MSPQQVNQLTAQLKSWQDDLDTEASAHTVVLEQQLQFDNQDAAAKLKAATRREAEKEAATQREMDSFYLTVAAKNSDAATMFHASTRTTLADRDPPVREADVFVIYWVDLGVQCVANKLGWVCG